MKKLITLLIVVALEAEFFVNLAFAARYWASTSGSNTANCADIRGTSEPSTTGTIARAVACATSSGDQVYIKPGTYTSNATLLNPSSNITIQGSDMDQGNWPVIQPTGRSVRGVNFSAVSRTNITFKYLKWDFSNVTTGESCLNSSSDAPVSNLVLEDFECLGPKSGQAGKTGSGIRSSSAGSSWIIRRGKIRRWVSGTSNPGAHGLYWSGSRGLIENVEVTNVNGYCIQLYSSGGAAVDENEFRLNKCDDVGRGTVFIQANADGNLIDRNILRNWGGSQAVTFNGKRTKFFHNALYKKDKTNGIGIAGCGAACQIANNIIDVGGTAISGSNDSVTLTTNKTSGGAACWKDPENGDFTLVEGAPCIAAATPIGATGLWTGSLHRGSAPDQGPFQSVGVK